MHVLMLILNGVIPISEIRSAYVLNLIIFSTSNPFKTEGNPAPCRAHPSLSIGIREMYRIIGERPGRSRARPPSEADNGPVLASS